MVSFLDRIDVALYSGLGYFFRRCLQTQKKIPALCPILPDSVTMRIVIAATLVASAAASNSTCQLLPEKTCWSNPHGKIASIPNISTDTSVCCDLCNQNPQCLSWNHGSKHGNTFTCDLYRDIGPNKTGNDGCLGGYRGAPTPKPVPRGDKPNIVFLVVESTDGRTWQRGYSNDLIPLDAIRELQEGGSAFHRHYANAPVCCPSRATFWSGRHAHKIPHQSAVPGGPTVQGAWNNYEGLPKDFDQRIDQVLSNNGYNTLITGKEDWTVGGHSENVYLNSWTMYTQFPYDINQTGGWGDETGDCASNGTVKPGGGPRGQGSAHHGDWNALQTGTAFIASAAKDPTTPFFIYQVGGSAVQAILLLFRTELSTRELLCYDDFSFYQGMDIVHPPYVTNEYWYNKIDPSKVAVPDWLPYDQVPVLLGEKVWMCGCMSVLSLKPLCFASDAPVRFPVVDAEEMHTCGRRRRSILQCGPPPQHSPHLRSNGRRIQ